MNDPRAYSGKEVVVLGAARSGQAVARLFRTFGATVTVNDAKPDEQIAEKTDLEKLGVKVIGGGHPDDLIHPGVSLVVKNPGIPYSISPVRRALELGIEIVTEVEVAWHLCQGPMVGITGSNGKTTTSTWVHRMFEAAGMDAVLAGNIGRPLCDAATDNGPGQWVIAELSSFQLKGTDKFRPRIGCLLNVYETHLDYHGTMEDYTRSKLKLFANQTAEDTAVLNADDPVCRRLMERTEARILPFSLTRPVEYGLYVSDGNIVWRDETGETFALASVAELGVPGRHNLENALAASAIARAAGIPLDAIGSALRSFRGVEHRQEFVREVNGVRIYNDSKATNPAAAIRAIEAFDAPVVWLGGGLDRGMEYSELIPSLAGKVKAAILFGETRHKLEKTAREAGVQSVIVVDTLSSAPDTIDRAVRIAYEAASPGDVILLSPACASGDMFPSFEERGSMFKASAHNL